ncbi:MAG: hypothetical protein WC532_05325 [Candidatus Omnitrophota bacterium]
MAISAKLAHEIKNSLAIILQGVECLRNNAVSADESMKTVVKYIEEAALKIDKAIKGGEIDKEKDPDH